MRGERTQAERLDSEYAVAWFNYARRRQEIFEAARAEVPALQERVSNPFLGQQRTTLPDNSRKGSWDGQQEKQETQAAQQEQQSQDASNNAEGDVGPKTAQGLLKQASTTLENTQNRGVLSDGVVSPEDSGTGNQDAREALSVAEEGVPKAAEKVELDKLRGKPLRNDETGIDAEVNTNQAGKLVSEEAVKKSKANGFTREQHYALAAKIKALWKHAIQLSEYVDEGGGDGKTTIKRFAVPVLIGGKLNYATILAKESVKHGHRIYTLEVHAEKTLQGKLDKPLASKDGSVFIPTRSVSEIMGALNNIVKSFPPPVQESPLSLERSNPARVSFEGEAAEAGSALAKLKKPVSMPEVMTALAKVIETVGGKAKGMFRRGHLGSKNALGQYAPYSQVTRVDSHDNMRTAAHELAHAIDAALWGHYTHWQENTLELSDAARAELGQLGKDLYKNGEPHNGYHSEGFAEIMRLWLTDREQTKQKAPEFPKWFESEVLEMSGRLAKAMAEAQALAHRFLRQGASAG